MSERLWIEEDDQSDLDSSLSDSESAIVDEPTISKQQFHETSSNGMLTLNEESVEYTLLKHRFYLSIGPLSQKCAVVAGYRNLHCSPSKKAQLKAFQIFIKEVADRRNGNPNVVHAWFGGLKDEVCRIMSDGFGVHTRPEDGGLFGFGLYLYPERCVGGSVLSTPADADGLRHLVVCRVILGNTEEILHGSQQCGPSSEDFDSGVDNQQSPSRYIVWYPNVKIHILPLYALSVKLDFHSSEMQSKPVKPPTSPWMPFTALLRSLNKILPRSTMCMIRRFHTDFTERKITREQLVFRVRRLTGDEFLVSAIKEFQNKRIKGKMKGGNK